MRGRGRYFLGTLLAAFIVAFLLPCAVGAQLVWQTSKDSAVALAGSQGRKVLLLAGRDT